MSDPHDTQDPDRPHTDGWASAYARAEARHGRRHHDTNRWSRYTAQDQDND